MLAFLIAIVPSIGVLFLFWLVIRAIVTADRKEREAQARMAAQQPPSRVDGEPDPPAQS